MICLFLASVKKFVLLGVLVCILLSVLIPVILRADAPAWWAARAVINSSATADDYAAVNQGQVKNIAKQAYEEMKAKGLIDPLVEPTALLVQRWEEPATSTDDYQAINIGQLKNVAKPFYDRLRELNYTGQPLGSGQVYPWGESTDDYALANIGQVKNLFSFIVPSAPDNPDDTDGDGLSDVWELAHFGSLALSASGDADGDGISNLAEYTAGSDPLAQDNSSVSLILFSPVAR